MVKKLHDLFYSQLGLAHRIWHMIKPDHYFHIANSMQIDGYTEFEIQETITYMKQLDYQKKNIT